MPWRSVFCSVFLPSFLKKNKTDRSFRFPGVFESFLQHFSSGCHQATTTPKSWLWGFKEAACFFIFPRMKKAKTKESAAAAARRRRPLRVVHPAVRSFYLFIYLFIYLFTGIDR